MLDRTKENIANGIKLSVVDIPSSDHQQKKTDEANDKPTKQGTSNRSSYITMFCAEFLGTGLLMFMGCMGCVTQVDNPPPVHHLSGLSFGLVVMMIIQLFGHISGAHLNPAVTIATILFKQITPMMGIVYVVAQFFGATLGFGLLKLLLPEEYTYDGFCTTNPNVLTPPLKAFAIEIIITCVLILVCCSVWDKRNADKADSVPLRFGLIVAAISMVAGPFTGASMNTARSFAPVIFAGNWTHQWIYWMGPNIGAILGCGIYKYLFEVRDDINREEEINLGEMSENRGQKV